MAAIIGYRCANLSSFSRPTICIQSYPWLRRECRKREVNFGQNMSNTGIYETDASLRTFRVIFIEPGCIDKNPVHWFWLREICFSNSACNAAKV